MADRRSAKREAFRTSLIEAAAARIAANGLQNLRARDVTADAGSALGGLYNAFADLDDLILHVNLETLKRLRRAVEEGLAQAEGPRAEMLALAGAYLAFARGHPASWAALFEHRMATERPLPDWYRDEQAALIHMIARPLGRLEPDLDAPALLVRARTIFGAVHGIVAVAMENRFVSVPDANLARELAQFVDMMVSGIESSGDRSSNAEARQFQPSLPGPNGQPSGGS